MKRFLTVLLALSAWSVFAAAEDSLSIELRLVGSDTLLVRFTNTGEKKTSFRLMDHHYQEFNYGIWIESADGIRNTACHFCDDNWFYPITVWSSTKSPEKQKKVTLKSGSNFTQELELHRMVTPLMWEITKDEAKRRIKDGDQEFISKLPLIENDFIEIPFLESVAKRNGPFKLKIRFEEIESNWIEMHEIVFEKSSVTTPATAPPLN